MRKGNGDCEIDSDGYNTAHYLWGDNVAPESPLHGEHTTTGGDLDVGAREAGLATRLVVA